jgi:hypothetical protein
MNYRDNFIHELTDENVDNYNTYESNKSNTKVNVLVTRKSNVLIDLKILKPISKYDTLNKYLPDQLKTSVDNEIKLKLYKSLILLDIQNKNITKFNILYDKLDTLDTTLDEIKRRISNKLTDLSKDLKTEYSAKLESIFINIQSSLNREVNSTEENINKINNITTTVNKIREII